MTGDTDLARLEKQAFRKFYEDGLFDVFLATMLLFLPLTGYLETWVGPDETLLTFAILIAYSIVTVGFIIARKRLVQPRLGTFTPSPRRKKKIHATRAILGGSVVLGLAAFALSSWVFQGGGSEPARDMVNLIPLLWLINATVVFGAMAYFLDVPRFYLYGPLFGVAGMLQIYSRTLFDYELSGFVAFGVPAAIIAAVGVYKLVHFLRDYPVPTDTVAYDGS